LQGDNDPVDVVEIGTTQCQQGGVYKVKPLGAYAMIDDGELDWKIVCIRTDDPKADVLNDIEDVERYTVCCYTHAQSRVCQYACVCSWVDYVRWIFTLNKTCESTSILFLRQIQLTDQSCAWSIFAMSFFDTIREMCSGSRYSCRFASGGCMAAAFAGFILVVMHVGRCQVSWRR